ncbi:uncharacterized protein LOC745092 isoform X1 [Pan troglodytes]|uniref:uncharacterized protein LOC745092 isoform X1 n=1 Tax=Pan troglodytes TaxID=9598 RepID=UPI0023F515C2|nr:uncharacterized protein LOC745092 isoform X1 [Pan troglodytes]XP_054521286.1 uncharacterized protein LOC745092 isoform X1 [Pan troglodytes]XP_054521287.1 uncharacterized protein LOC745092 isoform X1 [Pan troglodytes]XP_054521288.1 uncharacterized protein LOC745092 isoform X1 [Pan troglodytes]XP_054521289.1 uncharacterized protein LOC745092 isoform X1 [Pan troglodytes]XP_054521290.1 uncharacterized protein LOC745092 isoform X1 [Pan troglodytes]XP_054521291.1 uncharacterized protein LOC74509
MPHEMITSAENWDVETLVAGPGRLRTEQVFWTTDTLPRRPPQAAPPQAHDSAPLVSAALPDWSSDGLRQPPQPTQIPADLGKSPPSLKVRGPPRFPEGSQAAGTYLRPPASGKGRATARPPTTGTARTATGKLPLEKDDCPTKTCIHSYILPWKSTVELDPSTDSTGIVNILVTLKFPSTDLQRWCFAMLPRLVSNSQTPVIYPLWPIKVLELQTSKNLLLRPAEMVSTLNFNLLKIGTSIHFTLSKQSSFPSFLYTARITILL